MNKQEIIAAINEYITSNGVQEITGQVMNLILKSIANVIPDNALLTSSFGGIVKSTDIIATTPGLGRWFFAKAGTYNNYGGHTFLDSTLNILSFDGSEWKELELDVPQTTQSIVPFSTSTFPLVAPTPPAAPIQRTDDNFIWELLEGKTANATDIPSENPTIWKSIGGAQLNVDNGAFSYKSAKNVLGDFLKENSIETIKIDSLNVLYGGNFLTNNNTYFTDGAYPNIGVIYNYPVGDAKLLRVTGIQSMQNPTHPEYATIVGVKNGQPIVLMDGMADGDQLHEYDVTGFQTVSFQIMDGTFPNIELERQGLIATNVYDKLSILSSFLEPEETTWTDVVMPQPDEFSNAIMNTAWSQYGVDGAANGLIHIADLPDDAQFLEIDGNFNVGGGGTLWLAGINNSTNVYEQLLKGVAGTGKKQFQIDRDKYASYVYSRFIGNQKFRVGKTVKLSVEKDSVKSYIDNHISSGSSISNEKSAQIKRPSKVLRLEFTTTDSIPVDKTTIASGTVLITDLEGLGIKKFATIEVQGSSSAIYPKKNWTFALYNNESKTESFKLRVGNWAEHSEFVFKSNWIDATHCRNILSNQIWEDIIQNREGYPKRENEIAYSEAYTAQSGRFDSGALTHVDGLAAELYINGSFYGIGNFNLGKKRENYDIVSSNQNHIQMSAEVHVNMNSYVPEHWEIRNPKLPDANFLSKINAWFAANALSGQAFKDSFETNHHLKNAIDFFLLVEFIKSPDMYDKNFILTSWNGVKFYFLPYDMDTTFGLQWDGQSFTGHTGSIREVSFWNKFYLAYTIEIKARYLDLKNKGVFTLDNVYRHADLCNKTFGIQLFKKEQALWSSIPSNSIIYTSFPQIYEWTKNRIIWLDSQYL